MLCLHNTHQFDAAIKVVIFENSLPLRNADLIETGDRPGGGVRVKRGQSAVLARR